MKYSKELKTGILAVFAILIMIAAYSWWNPFDTPPIEKDGVEVMPVVFQMITTVLYIYVMFYVFSILKRYSDHNHQLSMDKIRMKHDYEMKLTKLRRQLKDNKIEPEV